MRAKNYRYSQPSGMSLKNIIPFFFGCAACGILVPRLGIEPSPMHWKRRVLTTGPPGKSLKDIILSERIQETKECILCASVYAKLKNR